MNLIPVSYFPAPTHRVFADNERRIRDTAYAEFFTGRMYLPAEAVGTLREPLAQAEAVPPDQLHRLLDAPNAGPAGYCVLPDDTAYIAHDTQFPGATADQLIWWFRWFAGEPERYLLWHPYSHIWAAHAHSAPDGSQLPGVVVQGVEYVGHQKRSVRTRFVTPEAWGIDASQLPGRGIVASVQAEILLGPIRVGRMLRLAREYQAGLVVSSHFWLGDAVVLDAGVGSFDIGPALGRLGIKRRLISPSAAYDQLFKDIVGMTHLAGFLPAVHARFAAQR